MEVVFVGCWALLRCRGLLRTGELTVTSGERNFSRSAIVDHERLWARGFPGREATRAALSGSQNKAPGFAGG
jgi:hypothetical protein